MGTLPAEFLPALGRFDMLRHAYDANRHWFNQLPSTNGRFLHSAAASRFSKGKAGRNVRVRGGHTVTLEAPLSQNPFPIAHSRNEHMPTELLESDSVAHVLSLATTTRSLVFSHALVSQKSVA